MSLVAFLYTDVWRRISNIKQYFLEKAMTAKKGTQKYSYVVVFHDNKTFGKQ